MLFLLITALTSWTFCFCPFFCLKFSASAVIYDAGRQQKVILKNKHKELEIKLKLIQIRN